MATYTCAFTIPSGQNNANGAKLTGSGFGSTPTLNAGDSLAITVQATGNSPAQLNGYIVFSPAADVPTQTLPSPFQNNGKFLCFKSQAGVAGQGNGQGASTYNFGSFTYNGGYAGHYELTFVAEDPATGTQWSEDPEFIVEG